jgi:choline dehydrogenase-like flavoprotein
MADGDIDVVIVGSGFAGSLIANALAKRERPVKIVILEAGDGVPTNINAYMERFYTATAKVPESPYPPSLFDDNGQAFKQGKLIEDPGKVAAGRPTALSINARDWADGSTSYLVQNKQSKNEQLTPFSSTYDRVAGGTSHWLGTSLRFVPNDFQMKTKYGASVPQFVDWPIRYEDLIKDYHRAEEELGVSGNAEEQSFLGITFGGFSYPMPQIPNSLTDRAIAKALQNLDPAKTSFLGMEQPPTEIRVRGLPAARNSQPYKGRRACAGNTNCIPICPIQAKYDPTVSLNEALNHKHVEMISNAVAYDIVVGDDGKVSEIKYYKYVFDGTKVVSREARSIKARIYVIAANAIETPRLLMMSSKGSRTQNGVANSSGMVGKHLMDHPYYVAWGQLPITADPVFPYRGPLITSGIGDLCDGPFRAQRGAFRVDIGNEAWNFVIASVVGTGDPNVTAIDFVNGANRSQLNPQATAMFGPALTGALNQNITRQFRIGFLVEQTPDPENYVTLSSKFKDGLDLPRPEISYRLSAYAKAGIVTSYRFKKLLFEKMGATDFTRVADEDPSRWVEKDIDGEKDVPLNYTGAGHIMGTYRMGRTREDSVVDSFQQSHDHENLYLVGSGTFPTGATANPTLTISALALRTADAIAKRV